LHAVGRIGLSAGLLNKPAPMRDAERELVRALVRVGHEIVAKIRALEAIAQVIPRHHERFGDELRSGCGLLIDGQHRVARAAARRPQRG
jgi:hypothetical protein